MRTSHEALPILKEQRELIKILVEDKNASWKKFQQVLKTIEDTSLPTKASIVKSTHVIQGHQDTFANTTWSLDADQSNRWEEIEHHCALIKSLMSEISAGRYKINHGIRYRMHQGVLIAHWDEWSPLRKLYGDAILMKALSPYSEVVCRIFKCRRSSPKSPHSSDANPLPSFSVRPSSGYRNWKPKLQLASRVLQRADSVL